jgi:GNAT superfamily N-acetyltransferase
MPIAIRDRHMPRPALTPLAGLEVRPETRPDVMASLQNKHEAEMTRRFADGHRAYVAWRSGEPAAWGWLATRTAHIGELGSTFSVPAGERYLWNFVTHPDHRGLGIYPRLLNAITEAEESGAERFWVAYAPENHASGAGIRKAGFTEVAGLSFDAHGRPAVTDIIDGGGRLAAQFLGIPAVDEILAQCWRCAKQAAPAASSCHAGACACDYQRVEVGCAR